ncbi:hypothetical protein SK128_011609, partial [Halocaridina rubra]
AFMIATLIKDYTDVLRAVLNGNTDNLPAPPAGGGFIEPPPWPEGTSQQARRSRPPSIMARPPPTLTEEVITH